MKFSHANCHVPAMRRANLRALVLRAHSGLEG